MTICSFICTIKLLQVIFFKHWTVISPQKLIFNCAGQTQVVNAPVPTTMETISDINSLVALCNNMHNSIHVHWHCLVIQESGFCSGNRKRIQNVRATERRTIELPPADKRRSCPICIDLCWSLLCILFPFKRFFPHWLSKTIDVVLVGIFERNCQNQTYSPPIHALFWWFYYHYRLINNSYMVVMLPFHSIDAEFAFSLFCCKSRSIPKEKWNKNQNCTWCYS